MAKAYLIKKDRTIDSQREGNARGGKEEFSKAKKAGTMFEVQNIPIEEGV